MIYNKQEYIINRPMHSAFLKLIFCDEMIGVVVDVPNWLEAKKYCESNSAKIKVMEIRFRSNVEHIDVADDDSLFFKTGAVAQIGGSINTFNSFLVGKYRDGMLHLKKYKLPEIEKYAEEERELSEEDTNLVISGR